MIYECEECHKALPSGSLGCLSCGTTFDEAVPQDAEVAKRGWQSKAQTNSPAAAEAYTASSIPASPLEQPFPNVEAAGYSVPLPSGPNQPPWPPPPRTYSATVTFPGIATGPKVKYGWLGEAWMLFAAEPGIWIAATLAQFLPIVLIYVAMLAFGIVGALVAPHSTEGSSQVASTAQGFAIFGELLVFIPACILTARLNYATYYMANKQVRGEALTSSDIWKGGPNVWKVLWLSLIVNVLILCGAVVFYVGALVVIALTLPSFTLAADGIGVMASLQRSFDAMKKDWLNAVVLSLLLLLLVFPAIIFCGLGLFVWYPMCNIVAALAYRDMAGMPGVLSPVAAGETAPLA